MQYVTRRMAAEVIALGLVLGGWPARAQDTTKPSVDVGSPDADNSRVNARSDGKVGLSADQQSNNKTAIETTRQIRKALTDDKTLSIYAHNIKVIWKDGSVVLKGPVNTAEEKHTVEAIAAKAADGTNVKSEIEVAAH